MSAASMHRQLVTAFAAAPLVAGALGIATFIDKQAVAGPDILGKLEAIGLGLGTFVALTVAGAMLDHWAAAMRAGQ